MSMGVCVCVCGCVYHVMSCHVMSINQSIIQSISQSINQSISHIVDVKWQNCLKVGTDKFKLKVKMQSVSDDDVQKRLVEKPCFELAAKGVFRLGRRYIFQQGVPGLCATNRESTATDSWSLDKWHQKMIGACRMKRPSTGRLCTGMSGPRYGAAFPWRTLMGRAILYLMCFETRDQWRLASTSVMCGSLQGISVVAGCRYGIMSWHSGWKQSALKFHKMNGKNSKFWCGKYARR